MTESNVVKLKLPPHVESANHLECPKCGATTELKCNCGIDYKFMPASKVAEKAIMENPEKSDRAIAADIGVHHATVSRVRNTVANATVEKLVGIDGRKRGRGRHVAIPDGYKCLSELIKATINLELGGVSRIDACKQTGITKWTYQCGRDSILLLSQSLSDQDMRTVKKAVAIMDQTGEVTHADFLVRKIAYKIWGKKKQRISSRGIKRRCEDFLSSISFLLSTCVNSMDIEIPYLSDADKEMVTKELKEAETALIHLRERIGGRSKSNG